MKYIRINCGDEEINLSVPELIREIHRGYVEAAADVIETNTFAANRIALGRFGLGDRVTAIACFWPLISYKNAEFMKNEVPGVVVPDHILERMSAATTREDGIARGVEIAREVRAAIAPRVAGFQVSEPSR